jgi:hypothetical protein
MGEPDIRTKKKQEKKKNKTTPAPHASTVQPSPHDRPSTRLLVPCIFGETERKVKDEVELIRLAEYAVMIIEARPKTGPVSKVR